MKIAIIADVLGEENNGTVVACMNLIRYLKSKGHELHIVCPDETKEGVEGYYILKHFSFGIFNKYMTKNGVAPAKADYNIIRKAIEGCDVCHILLPFSAGKCARIICEELGIPFTAAFHCQAENISAHAGLAKFGLLNRKIYKIFYKRVFKYADGIHYPTEFIKNVFEHVVGPTKAYVISNGVNARFVNKEVEKPKELRDKFCILFTGRFSKEKTHKVLINAVRKSKYEAKTQLIFAGCGPLEKKIRKWGNKLTNKPIMNFFSRDEMVNVINYSDLYVHPAEIEIEAISCLEAISCGLVPVIANSKKCATKHFALSDKNLFKNKDSKNLKDKIEYWMEHEQEKEEMRIKYLDYTNQYEQSKCMERMEEMLIGVSKLKKEPIKYKKHKKRVKKGK